jgi:hypothetical protein
MNHIGGRCLHLLLDCRRLLRTTANEWLQMSLSIV